MELQPPRDPPRSSGVNASYNAPNTWVFRLSNTTRIVSAFGKWTSTR